jgi:phage regulator Rha-like protein
VEQNMNDVDFIRHNGDIRIDSRLLAPHVDVRHRDTFDLIRKYAPQLSELGVLPFQTEKPNDDGGRPQKYALLNEDQCYFLLTLMRNTDKVVELKLKLVKGFREARAALAKWEASRLEGKKVRRIETDAIKDLVAYASAHGSKHAENYYSNITRMVNEILGVELPRDRLGEQELKRIAMAETLVDMVVRDGIVAELPYRSIYRVAKERVTSLVPILPTTRTLLAPRDDTPRDDTPRDDTPRDDEGEADW